MRDLTEIINIIPGNVYWKDRAGYYRGCNKNLANMLGLNSPEEIIGKTLYDFFDQEYADYIHNIDEQVMCFNQMLEIEEPFGSVNSKQIFLTKKTPLYDGGNIIGLLGISVDITQRKINEAEVISAKLDAERNSQLRQVYLDSILAELPENIFWSDVNSTVLGCNDNQARLFGLNKASELVGKDLNAMAKLAGWTPEMVAKIRENDLKIINTGMSEVVEETVNIRGEIKTFLSSKKPLRDVDNHIIGVFGITVNITERIKKEEELRVAKERAEMANIAKTEFIKNMSHDLRTPLNGIYGLSQILFRREADQVKKQDLGYILSAAEELTNLLNEIIDVSSIETGLTNKDVTFNLDELFDNVIKLFTPQAKANNIELVKKINTNELSLLFHGDETKIHRILLNLVGNALKFTKHGSVTIELATTKKSNHLCEIALSVADTGIGIPTDKLESIFEKFTKLNPSYQGKYHGTGLGLYIVKEFVEQLGGRITVASELGKGSQFLVSLTLNYVK